MAREGGRIGCGSGEPAPQSERRRQDRLVGEGVRKVGGAHLDGGVQGGGAGLQECADQGLTAGS